MILIYSSERLYRETEPAGELHGQYDFWHNGQWHRLVNPDFCRLLDRGYDPHRVVESRNTKASSADWLSGMSNQADWLPSLENGKPDEPLNAPAALIYAHDALIEAGRHDEANMLVRLVSLRDLYDSPWLLASRTTVESDADFQQAVKRYSPTK